VMALKHLDGFVVVPEEMYAQLTEKRALHHHQPPPQPPPQDQSTLTADDVIEALPASLRERGTKLVHLLRTVMEWNRRGEIVNRYTDTPIPGSNVVNAVRYLLGDEGVDDPAKRYVAEVARDTHILPAIGDEEGEMDEEGHSDLRKKKKRRRKKKKTLLEKIENKKVLKKTGNKKSRAEKIENKKVLKKTEKKKSSVEKIENKKPRKKIENKKTRKKTVKSPVEKIEDKMSWLTL
jgi:hypothetical protein